MVKAGRTRQVGAEQAKPNTACGSHLPQAGHKPRRQKLKLNQEAAHGKKNAGGGGACRTHPHVLHLTPRRLPRVNGAGRGAPLLLLLPRLPLLHHLHGPLNSLLKQSAGREELNLLHQKRRVQTPLLVPPRLPSLRTLLSPDLKPACLLCFAPLTLPDCSPTGPKPLPAAQATLIPSEASGPLGSVLGLSGK